MMGFTRCDDCAHGHGPSHVDCPCGCKKFTNGAGDRADEAERRAARAEAQRDGAVRDCIRLRKMAGQASAAQAEAGHLREALSVAERRIRVEMGQREAAERRLEEVEVTATRRSTWIDEADAIGEKTALEVQAAQLQRDVEFEAARANRAEEKLAEARRERDLAMEALAAVKRATGKPWAEGAAERRAAMAHEAREIETARAARLERELADEKAAREKDRLECLNCQRVKAAEAEVQSFAGENAFLKNLKVPSLQNRVVALEAQLAEAVKQRDAAIAGEQARLDLKVARGQEKYWKEVADAKVSVITSVVADRDEWVRRAKAGEAARDAAVAQADDLRYRLRVAEGERAVAGATVAAPLPKPQPCPFCGARATLDDRDDGEVNYVTCDAVECHATGPSATTRERAVREWNAMTVGRAV